jgi:hypothetical protein
MVKSSKKSKAASSSMLFTSASSVQKPALALALAAPSSVSMHGGIRPPPQSSSTTKKNLIDLWTSRQNEESNWNIIACQYPLQKDFLYNNEPMVSCTDGYWLCLLCKRKFNSEDAVSSHVKRSKLHKTNVNRVALNSKKKENEDDATTNLFSMRPMEMPKVSINSSLSSSTSSSSSKHYSKQRINNIRKQIESSSSNTSFLNQPKKEKIIVASTSKPMNTTNSIGAMILKRMGWKEGDGLRQNGLKVPLDAVRQLGGRLGGRGGRERLGLGHEIGESVDLSNVLARQREKQRRNRGRPGRR